MQWISRLMDSLIRSRAKLEQAPLDRYRVLVAREADALEQAFALVQRAYAAKGIEADLDRRLRMTPQHMLEESHVFVVVEGEGRNVVGTLTATLDSKAGVPLDKDYPEALRALRHEGHRVAELGSLAVEPAHRRAGATTLLFMAAHWFVREVLRADMVAIGVNPAIERVYRALFDFDRLGPPRMHAELTAPVVGLWHRTRSMHGYFAQHYQRPMQNGRSVFENFLVRLPHCIEIPRELGAREHRGWQLDRDVLREVFVRRSDCFRDADATTHAELCAQRSDETLQFLEGRGA